MSINNKNKSEFRLRIKVQGKYNWIYNKSKNGEYIGVNYF